MAKLKMKNLTWIIILEYYRVEGRDSGAMTYMIVMDGDPSFSCSKSLPKNVFFTVLHFIPLERKNF